MTTWSANADYDFGIHIRIRTSVKRQESDADNPGVYSAKVISVPALVSEAEPKRHWWRLFWPILSVAGTTAVRWILRMHGIG